MGFLKGRGKSSSGSGSSGGSQRPFPHIDVADAPRLHALIDAFEAERLISETAAPARGLAALSESSGLDDSRTIWVWFAAWCEQARSLGSPLTAVKIAEFTQTFHDQFMPASDKAWVYLYKATDGQRATIENAAFDACADLDPDKSVRADMDLPVSVFRRYLSERLGRPLPPEE